MSHRCLDSTEFPLYAVQALAADKFVVAGGGGAAKTGVKNAMNVYQLERDGRYFKAALTRHFETGPRAIMSMCLSPTGDVIAASADHLCTVYRLKGKDSKSQDMTIAETGKFATVAEPPADAGADFEQAYQKCVCFTPDGQRIVTGGSDGHVKVFKYTSLQLERDINAHPDEVEDLHVSPDSKLIISISKGSSACLWKISDGLKELELPFSVDKKDEDLYRFRNCRFSKNRDTDSVHLYSAHNPKKFSKVKPPTCLVKWNTHKWIPEITVQIPKQTISALACSTFGRYVGVGTADGSVLVYTAWNLRHVQTARNVHNIFVTGLAFLPESKTMCEEMRLDAALVSCSIDNTCQLTVLPSRREYSFVLILTVCVLTIILVFNVIAYFDVYA